MTEINQSSNLSSELLNELVGSAAAALGDGHLSFGEIVSLGGVLAGKANQIVHLSGSQKKELVLQVVDLALKKVVDSAPEKDREALAVKVNTAGDFAKKVLPTVLDVVVSAARGKLNLRKPDMPKSCISSIKSLFHLFRGSSVSSVIQEKPKEAETLPSLTLRKPSDVVQEEVVVPPQISPSLPSEDTPQETQVVPEKKDEPKEEKKNVPVMMYYKPLKIVQKVVLAECTLQENPVVSDQTASSTAEETRPSNTVSE